MKNRYHVAEYILNAPSISHAPEDAGVEVAFAGRSNAGKSSAINALTNQKSLARTSKTPGRTQHLVFFRIDDDTRLVDLPGYGYAKVPEKIKRQWHSMMEEYLAHRQSLQGIVLVMDIRHPLKEFDRQMLEWGQHTGLPVHILLTKADKLKRGAGKNQLLAVQKELNHSYPNSSIQIFSAKDKVGIDDLCKILEEWTKNS